ncbi:MAG: MCE family protein [Myxococcales bacterium]|nr:MCE family protein [Myxococcales bacterium]
MTRLTAGAMIVIIVAAGALLIRSKVPSAEVAGSFRTYAKFRDASRLAHGSPVVIAGVRVGVIEKMVVVGTLARVDMRLIDGLDLPAESFATRRADSLFGDSYIEIIPSSGDEGAGPARRLRSGEPIIRVVEGGSTDAILRGMADALPRIDNALEVVHDAVITGRKWVSGPLDDRFAGTATWLGEGHIEGPMASADRAMIRIDELTTRGADRLERSAPEVTGMLDRIDRAVVQARGKLRDTRVGLVDALRDTREGLDRIDPQIAQATELMAAIDQGSGTDWKGTLGRLVNDRELGETLEDAAAGGREAAASLNQFRSWLGMRVEFNVFARAVRFYATAEIRAHSDKFYLVEFERGPLGGIPNDELSDIVGSEDFTRRQEIQDRLRFTAQFGKQIGWLAMRGGIKDSTVGFGVDARLFDGRLKLSADLYGGFTPTPRFKVAGALAVFRSLYVLAGVDDALSEPGYLSVVSGNPGAPKTFDKVRYGRDYFVGTTLSFTDEDIAVLLRLYGALLVGLL